MIDQLQKMIKGIWEEDGRDDKYKDEGARLSGMVKGRGAGMDGTVKSAGLPPGRAQGGVKTKAVTNIGDFHHDVHRAGVETKAVSLGDFHQDGHRAGNKTKAVTNIGDSYQDRHRAGVETKAVTNIGDSV